MFRCYVSVTHCGVFWCHVTMGCGVFKCYVSVTSCAIFRCYISVTVLDGSIYALGGLSGDGELRARHDTVEILTPSKSNEWSFIDSMSHRRSNAAAAALLGENLLSLLL